ncbi:MAG: xanthine dehydrogenase accessory protein XdhC [Clostridia bacterium]|nr:xanthine dehydrogenase accessory protein XdhC [Deltaproteobacteria bacterium]
MWSWADAVHDALASRNPCVLVTLIRCDGSTPRAVGAKMLVDAHGRIGGSIGGGSLEERAVNDARECLADGEAKLVHVKLGPDLGQCCGGAVDVFCEPLNVGPELYIFGAGHVAQALVSVLVSTPFCVHVVDERDEWLNAAAMPTIIFKHNEGWNEVVRVTKWQRTRSYAIVMTHSHDADEEIIRAFAAHEVRFLGLIGSGTKWQRIRKRLEARGIDEGKINRIRCPVGLDIGGKTPREVAISIAAELLAVHHGRKASEA